MSAFCRLLVLLMVTTTSGCGFGPAAEYGKLDLVSVSGTITLDDQPLPAAVVTFEDPANGAYSYGLTGSNGSYTLRLDSVKSGVTTGKKIVRVSTTRKILGLNSSEESGESSTEGTAKAAPEPEKVPERYNKKSELTADVSSSQTKFDFKLLSK